MRIFATLAQFRHSTVEGATLVLSVHESRQIEGVDRQIVPFSKRTAPDAKQVVPPAKAIVTE
jgi:hypothetical protein